MADSQETRKIMMEDEEPKKMIETEEKEDEESKRRVKKKDEEEEEDFKRWVKKKEEEQDKDLNMRIKAREKEEHEPVRRRKQQIKKFIEEKEAEEEAKRIKTEEGDETHPDFWRRVNQKVKRMIEEEEEEEKATGIKKEELFDQFHENIGKIVEDEKCEEAKRLNIPKKDCDKIIHESALRQSQENNRKMMIKQRKDEKAKRKEDEKAKGTVETEEEKAVAGCRIDDPSALDFLWQLLPVKEHVPHRQVTNRELALYCTKVNESQGFDVPRVRGTLFGKIEPLYLDNEYEIMLRDLSKQALETYNQNNQKSGSSRFFFDGLVKVNCQVVSGMIYYITFKAITFHNISGTFRAKVWKKISGPPEIKFCEMVDS